MQTRQQKRQRRKMHIRKNIAGTASKPRLMVFRSSKHIYASLIDDVAGKMITSTSDLKLKSGKGIERAQTVGTEIAKLAAQHKVSNVVFDRAGYKFHGRVKSLADAAREAGLQF